MPKMPKKILPVRKTMCATCPYRPNSIYAWAQNVIVGRAAICHSTGNSAILGRTGKPEKICRGARNVQLKLFTALGLLKEPTDAAWAAKCKELNLK
jgi:hypothetical protein